MKIKKIATQCKEAGNIILFNVTDKEGCVSQWISNGYGVYPITGMPYMQMEHLITMFEITDKQLEKIRTSSHEAPSTIDFSDICGDEIIAEREKINIISAGKVLLPVTASGHTYFINKEYLKPIQTPLEDTELYLRKSPDGTPYFAVKAGLMLVGIIMPISNAESLAQDLQDIAARAVR